MDKNELMSAANLKRDLTIGTAQEVIDQIKRYEDLGYDEFSMWLEYFIFQSRASNLMNNLPHYQLFINGTWCDGSKGQTEQSVSPATGKAWATFACASADDVDSAVRGAKKTLYSSEWRDLLPTARGKLLYKLDRDDLPDPLRE